MTEHHFSLVPFPDPVLPRIQISGRVARERNLLSIQYSLAGSTGDILFPKPATQPGRRDELWMETCFEFFLALPGQPQYWEFNLSPAGHWNTYRMDAYRRIGFREEPLIEQLQVECRKEVDCLSAAVCVDLSSIIPSGEVIQVGITSVLQTRSGSETYWALSHPAPQADFHSRESFLLQL